MDPWPRMRAVVTAVVSGLNSGQFVEETLNSLRPVLGASSAWARLGSRRSGRVVHSRLDDLSREPAKVLSHRADKIMMQVLHKQQAVLGSRQDCGRSFVGLPIWSSPPTPRLSSRLVGAMYVEFVNLEEVPKPIVDFIESVALLLGGVAHQQSLIDTTKEDLRATRAKEPSAGQIDLEDLVAGESMRAIRDEVYAALPSNSSIMILGESGTGKTQLAIAIARASTKGPIVRATLGLSDDLNTITSELFGHERGAFSGAVSKRKGLVEYANGGTLILDEVLNLPAHAQQLLLDFTQFGTYRPLGFEGSEPKTSNFRLISVTNGNMAQAISDTRFRQDLYFRLATVPITMLPLRDRREDITGLAVGYLLRADPHMGWNIDESAKSLLSSSHLEWAGNIRQLESVLERARNRLLASDDSGRTIGVTHLDLKGGPQTGSMLPAPLEVGARRDHNTEGSPVLDRWLRLVEQRLDLDNMEREIIEDALRLTRGGRSQDGQRASGFAHGVDQPYRHP